MKKLVVSILAVFLLTIGFISPVSANTGAVSAQLGESKDLIITGEGRYVKFSCDLYGEPSGFPYASGVCHLRKVSNFEGSALIVDFTDRNESDDVWLDKGVKYKLTATNVDKRMPNTTVVARVQ